MKTIKQIENEIKKVKEDMTDAAKEMKKASTTPSAYSRNKRVYKNCAKKLELVNTCALYLRTEPAKSFVQKEVDRVNNRLQLIEDGYVPPPMMGQKELTKAKKAYEKEYLVPKLKSQLKFLKFILS